jgi:pimeloyl-ACP methyl ester carboxylesterase
LQSCWLGPEARVRRDAASFGPKGNGEGSAEGTKYFCGDLSEQEQKLVWATQGVPRPDLFEAKVGGAAWRSKPSWYIVGKKDRTVHPDLERFFAKRMGATTYEFDSSHVPMLSQPERVIDVIRTAAKADQGSSATA